jgi:hypothetical protein
MYSKISRKSEILGDELETIINSVRSTIKNIMLRTNDLVLIYNIYRICNIRIHSYSST